MALWASTGFGFIDLRKLFPVMKNDFYDILSLSAASLHAALSRGSLDGGNTPPITQEDLPQSEEAAVYDAHNIQRRS
jgi:hypothetical protein